MPSIAGGSLREVLRAGAQHCRRVILHFAFSILFLAILPASAIEPIPTYEVRIYPTIFVKSGQQDLMSGGNYLVTNDYQEGVIRSNWVNVYEQFWKEQTYYKAGTNGRPANGIWFRTHTEGYEMVPWPLAFPYSNWVPTAVIRPGTYGRDLPAWMKLAPHQYTKFDDVGTIPYGGPARGIGEPNWEVPPAGAAGAPGQLFVNTNQTTLNPLLDNVWTPGEAFYDANSNGMYDLGRKAEDRWWAENKIPPVLRTNWPGPPLINEYISLLTRYFWDPRRGEIYVDYMPNTVAGGDGRVTTVGFDAAVELWIRSGTNLNANVKITISEFNFAPQLFESNGPAYHGDFYHHYYSTNYIPGTQTNILTNQLFDFNVNLLTGDNLVYRALDYDGNPLFLEYQVWQTNGVPYRGTDALADHAVLRNIRVPAYQASELFGIYYRTVDNLRLYTDSVTTTNRGTDGAWDDEIHDEPFEDFISWWDPGDGTIGCPVGWIYVKDATVQSVHLKDLTGSPRRSDRTVLITTSRTCSNYVEYVTRNYPGNVTSLLARATNGVYDGPDNWRELANCKYRWDGFIPPLTMTTPSPLGGTNGDYGGYWPLVSTNDFTWFAGDSIPSVDENYDPGNSKTNSIARIGWIPVLSNSWSYDNAREFCDLASSLQHSAGDGRLGEITSYQSHSIYGEAVKDGDMDPNKVIMGGGPRTSGVFGNHGMDAGNVMSLELYTWGRPEYQSWDYGARSNSSHNMDGNLDGMVDQGESRVGYPNYTMDDDVLSPHDGDGEYPFNYQRLVEDMFTPYDWLTPGGLTGTFYHIIVWPPGLNADGRIQAHTGKGWSVLSKTGQRVSNLSQQVPWNGMLSTPSHEQSHEFYGAIDLYDFDRFQAMFGVPAIINLAIGGYSFMGNAGGLVHESPINKKIGGWIADQPLTNVLTEGGGPMTIEMYPMEATSNAYYYFNRIGSYYSADTNVALTTERMWFWYSDQSSRFSYYGPGVYVLHENLLGNYEQRLGNLYFAEMIQADGMNHLQDGVNGGDSGDPFPGSNNTTCFTVDTLPPAYWYDEHDPGIRVNDFVIPARAGDPAQVTFEWYDPRKPWPSPWWGADNNSNSIPDVWEFHHFGRLDVVTAPTNVIEYGGDVEWEGGGNGMRSISGGSYRAVTTASSDFDLDRLPDWAEWLSNTDPLTPGSYELDSDGDGLSNGEETMRLRSHPLLPDTDDDGLSDRLDRTNSCATNALSPAIDRVLSLDGQTNSYVLMPGSQGRFKLNDWTIMAWVKPSANCNNGLIISRDAGNNNFNYCLGLTNGPKPFVKFSASPNNSEVRLLSSANLPLNRWAHIAGVFDSELGELSLYVDGNRVAYTVTGDRPAWNVDVSQQPGWSGQKVGQGFAGWIDEVGIFNQALARNEIEDLKSGIFWQTNALVAYYRFDDGTSATNNNGTWSGTSGRSDWNWGQVEDFAPAYVKGWMRMWRNAGTLRGQAEMVLAPSDAPVRLRERDSDGDGMPDWWELAHGLDPFSAAGVNGAWGDPDNDGLNNRAEYLAGTDPYNWDTFNTGLGDYDSRSGSYTRTYGEMYMDGDGMPDTWEVQYGLDPYHYDAHLDLDKDGWSNYAEYQAGTDPSNPYNYPWPTIWGSANYFGNQSGILHFFAYQINTMDGEPKVTKIGTDSGVYETIGQADGSTVFNGRLPIYPIDNTTEVQISANISNMVVIFTFTGPGQYTYNGPGTDYAANLDYTDGGFILRWASVAVPAAGENVSVAYSFVNRQAAVFSLNGFSEGDVYLLALMDLNSSDTFDAGEPLGIMEGQPLTLGYTSLSGVRIQVKDSAPGYGRFAWTASSTTTDYPVVVNKISESGSPNVLARNMHWSRNYVHEWDYQIAGLYGLSAGSYQWWMNNQNGTFSVTWPAAVSPPYLVYPRGEKLNYAVNQFKWAMDPNSTMFHLQVARQASDRGYAFVIDGYYPVPYRDGDGVSQAELPLYAGELGDGVYAWRVASWNPAGESAWSDPQTFSISLAATNSHWIEGGVYYFGKADSANIIVEAYDNKGFSGKPEARVLLSGAARTNSYKGLFALRGLKEGTYYVRAYLDVTPAGGTRDGKRNSPWESWGFIRVPTNSYQPRAIALVNTMFVDGTTLVIHDCDTDNDFLPDAWEMYYFGNLDQTGDMDYDGDGETNLEEYMRDGYDMNPANWDSDGDGLSDGFEFNYNPWSSGYRAKAGQQLNPALWDTDGDGYSDGAELRRYHTDPLDSGSYPGYQPMCFDAFRSPADYDGDGRTDMAVYDIANGDWYLMTGGGQFFTLPFGTAATMPMLGDYNGDGCDDFAVFDSATGAWHLYDAWSGQSFSLKFGDSEMIPVPADYDGDGRTDLAVYYPAEGMWYIYSVWQGQLINLQFGGPTMVPVPGDYNGDGGTDLAVFEPATGDWDIFTYNLYTHQCQSFSGNFGGPTMVPVPGDYDGDGRNDIVLFDTSTGNWHILTWKGQYLSGQFGWYGCIPVAGDYDGDGRSDICVYYPPSGMWYIYCWTGRSYQVQLGWPSAVPVLKGR